jgi:hypothetical protein
VYDISLQVGGTVGIEAVENAELEEAPLAVEALEIWLVSG